MMSLTARLRATPQGYSLQDTSKATNAAPRWTYKLVPRGSDVDYGVGAFLLLATELKDERWR